MKDVKYISTSHLDAVIVENDYIKVIVYNKKDSPYGWTKRQLMYSALGVDEQDFNYNYVKSAIDEVFSVFPYEEIDELLTKVNKYYEKNKKQV